MTSIIHSIPGTDKCKSGHNLDVLFRYAKTAGGVKAVLVNKLEDAGRPGAFVVIQYRNGAIGESYSVSSGHAIDLFQSYSRLSPKRSWWAGCEVREVNHSKGTWDYEKDAPK